MSADSADNLNELSHQIIGMAIEIHKKLGPGFQEKIYEEALLKELEKAEIGYQRQKVVRVDYDGQSLGNQRIDLLVGGEIILEIKERISEDVVRRLHCHFYPVEFS